MQYFTLSKPQISKIRKIVTSRAVWLGCFLFLSSISLMTSDESNRTGIRIAAVQLEVSDEILRDADTFAKKVESKVSLAVSRMQANLIVFPEYTSVFLALHPYYELIITSSTIEEALAGLTELNIKEGKSSTPLKVLFSSESDRVSVLMDTIWGTIARKYQVTIIAGTYFALDSSRRELRNRLVVYNLEGKRLYSQDKVSLTPFEIELLDLSPGVVEDARIFSVLGYPVATTICRDSYLPVWGGRFEGAAVWIDIKANGAPYTEEEAASFARALPARISEGSVPYGVTVCLNGTLLDLIWEGPSSVVAKRGGEAVYLDVAEVYRGESMLLFPVPEEGTMIRETSPPS